MSKENKLGNYDEGQVVYTEVARSYDARASELEEEYETEEMKKYRSVVLRAIGDHFKIPAKGSARIFEYGAGIGRVTRDLVRQRALSNKQVEVTAVDLSSKSLQIYEKEVKKANPQTRVSPIQRDVVSSLSELSDMSRYDLAYSFGTYQLSPADLEKTIEGVLRHLNEGGTYIFDFLPAKQGVSSYKNVHGNYENYEYSREYIEELIHKVNSRLRGSVTITTHSLSEMRDMEGNRAKKLEVINQQTGRREEFDPVFVVVQRTTSKHQLHKTNTDSKVTLHNKREKKSIFHRAFCYVKGKMGQIMNRLKEILHSNEEKNNIRKLNQFWNDIVLKDPGHTYQLTETQSKEEMKTALYRSLYTRLEKLIIELNIPVLHKKVSQIPLKEIINYSKSILSEESELLGPEQKVEIRQEIAKIRQLEKENSVESRSESEHRKEWLYMKFVSSYLSYMKPSVFSFLPSQAARYRVGDCSLATALGMVIAEKAGIHAIRLAIPNHVLLGVVISKDECITVDMNNSNQKSVVLVKEGILGMSNYYRRRFTDPLRKRQLYIEQSPESIVESVIGNTLYYINQDEQFNKKLASSVVKREDERVMRALSKLKIEAPLIHYQNLLFKEERSFLLTKEWKDEEVRFKLQS